jgi:uncharacterized membrane protein YbhN (UPF0104 family)
MFQSIKNFFKDDSHKVKNLKWGVTLAIVCVLLITVIIVVPWAKTWQVLVTSNLLLIVLAFSLTIPNQLLSTLSYYIVARRQKVSLSFWEIFKINMIMVFYDIVLPSTFFVSGLRWYRYAQHSKNSAQTLTSVTYLKAFTILLTVLMSFGLLLFFDTTTIQGYSLQIILLITGISVILYLTPIICKKIVLKLPQPEAFQQKYAILHLLYQYFIKVLSAFANFQNLDLKSQLLLIVIGIIGQWIQYFAYILFAESVGINLSLAQLGVVRAVLLLVANLPINFSVGISLRDVTLVSLLVAITVPMEKAVAMSIVVLAKGFFYGIIGGVLEAFQLIKHKKIKERVKIP